VSPKAGLKGAENLADCPVRSESLYRLSYPGPRLLIRLYNFKIIAGEEQTAVVVLRKVILVLLIRTKLTA
jgi:hypothetical protein